MNDLQREMRAAFERQQAGLGDVIGVRQRLLRKALTAPEPRRNQLFRTAVGLAAVLVAAAAVGTTVYLRALSHSGPVGHATPSPSSSIQSSPSTTAAATPLANPLQVPASTSVILYHDPVNADQIDGIAWDGTASGRVAATGATFGFIANPTGTLYAGFRDSEIHDRSGNRVASYNAGNQKGFGTWADDGTHYCQMVSASQLPPAGGEPATLQLGAVGTTARNIAKVGTMYDQAGVVVAACSVTHDRAVVVQSNSDGSSRQFWVVQLSTGRIILDSSSLGVTMQHVVATADVAYIAVVRGSTDTLVYGPTGLVLAHQWGAVQAFSWDGTLAVVTSFDGSVSLVRWRDGSRVWDAPHGLTYWDSVAEPGGQRLALGLRNPDYQQTGGFLPVDLYVVGPNGHATRLLQTVEF